MKIANLEIQTIESLPFSENTYVINCVGQTDCLIVDPGFEPDKILEYVKEAGLVPIAILNTHGHSDHIAGNEIMKKTWPDIPLIIGEADAEKLTDPDLNLSAPFGASLISPEADQTVKEGDELNYASIPLAVLDTPGHSRGHVVFLFRSEAGEPDVLIGGDVLFNGSIGRTDFPDGSFEDLVASIHNKLFVLEGDTRVLPRARTDDYHPAGDCEQPVRGCPGWLCSRRVKPILVRCANEATARPEYTDLDHLERKHEARCLL